MSYPQENASVQGGNLDVSVVMPCLNESRTLGGCIHECLSVLDSHRLFGEVIIADNGSTDGCPEIATDLGATVVAVPKRGYGAALCAGFAQAKSDIILMADSDGSYDFQLIPHFLEAIDQGFDLVVGDRFQGTMEPNAMPLLNRYLGNPALSLLGRVLFHCDVRDFHCGLRGFKKSAIEKMDLQTSGMEFASEMIVKATLLGMRVGEVPTTLAPDGRSRPPHLRPWRDGWRHLRFLLLRALEGRLVS